MAFITISYIGVKNFFYFEICIEKKQSELATDKRLWGTRNELKAVNEKVALNLLERVIRRDTIF